VVDYQQNKEPEVKVYTRKHKYDLPITLDEAKDYVSRYCNDTFNVLEILLLKPNRKIRLECKICGYTKDSILCDIRRNTGCIKCFQKSLILDREQLISMLKERHGDSFNYEKTIFNGCKEPITVFCNSCKRYVTFKSLDKHLYKLLGCQNCSKNISFGEKVVRTFLIKSNVAYVLQHTFEDCRNPSTNRSLQFDFFLPDLKVAIEYAGEQHFKHCKYFDKTEEEYIEACNRDVMKIEYCILRDIKLITIDGRKHKTITSIEKFLRNELGLTTKY